MQELMRQFHCSISTFHRTVYAQCVEHAAEIFVYWYRVETNQKEGGTLKVLIDGWPYDVTYPGGHVRRHKI